MPNITIIHAYFCFICKTFIVLEFCLKNRIIRHVYNAIYYTQTKLTCNAKTKVQRPWRLLFLLTVKMFHSNAFPGYLNCIIIQILVRTPSFLSSHSACLCKKHAYIPTKFLIVNQVIGIIKTKLSLIQNFKCQAKKSFE